MLKIKNEAGHERDIVFFFCFDRIKKTKEGERERERERERES